MIARIAELFHVLPGAVARDLDDDPELLSLECYNVLCYAKVKQLFDEAGTNDALTKHLDDTPHMLAVRRNTFELMKERRATRAAEDRRNG